MNGCMAVGNGGSNGLRRASDDERVTYKSSSRRRHSEFQVSPDALEVQRLQKLYTMFRKKASGGGDLLSPDKQKQLDKWLKELENRGGGVTSALNNTTDFLTTSPTPLGLSLRRSCSAKRSSGGAAGYKNRKQRANSHVAVASKIDDTQLALLSNQRIHRAHSHQAGPHELTDFNPLHQHAFFIYFFWSLLTFRKGAQN